MPDRRTADVGPELEDVRTARRFVSSTLDEWGIPGRDDVALVTSELVTNALTHASHPVALAIQRDEHCLRLEVSNGSAIIPVIRELDPARPGGRGMAIVQSLTTAWGAVSSPGGGKTVWVEFGL